ncbi:MAG: UDP-N-acetylmuramoyl-L-alanyl-D-glutamate--2,6-diaminopimelate ligase [Desulfobacterales bacterium]
MKLSTLLKAINPISVSVLQAERTQGVEHGNTDQPHAPDAPQDAKLPDLDIDSIHYRAQEVQPAGLFVAIEGQTADGHNFVHQALQNGAVAIVTQKEPPQPYLKECLAQVVKDQPIMIRVPDTRQAMADLSARFFGDPSGDMTLIGVTGTNGKTTVAYLLESILLQAGLKTGVIGTINYRYAAKKFSSPMTTPESLDLQRILAQMLSEGVTHVVMEASSHAMNLSRIRSCWFDVAVFTNLSQDHLDFHGDMQSYWSSKKRLFTEYLAQGPKKERAIAVINCNDPRGEELAETLPMTVITTGSNSGCAIKAERLKCKLIGTAGKVATPEGSFDFKTPLAGVHNVENILSAIGAAVALKLSPSTIKAGIEALSAIPGRLESIPNNSGRFVYVDYAHTPDALANALSAIKDIAPARIICVFGCGGDRDKRKRPLMGEIVTQLCDLSVVTSDNPRSEDPMAIIEQILPGARQGGGVEYFNRDLEFGFAEKGFVVEPDRRRAIELGIKASRPDDAVLIAGKGHETYQILGNSTIDFDDRREARKVLKMLAS